MKAFHLMYPVVAAGLLLSACTKHNDSALPNEQDAKALKEDPGPTPEPKQSEGDKIRDKDITKDPTGKGGPEPKAPDPKTHPACKAQGSC